MDEGQTKDGQTDALAKLELLLSVVATPPKYTVTNWIFCRLPVSSTQKGLSELFLPGSLKSIHNSLCTPISIISIGLPDHLW